MDTIATLERGSVSKRASAGGKWGGQNAAVWRRRRRARQALKTLSIPILDANNEKCKYCLDLDGHRSDGVRGACRAEP